MNLNGKLKEIDLDYLLEVECKTQFELGLLVGELNTLAKHKPNMIINQGKLYISSYDFKLLSPIFLNHTIHVRKINN